MDHIGAEYRADGWVKVPGVISAEKVDALMSAYDRDLKPSGSKFYRQNTNRYEGNSIDPYGHVTNSFLDPHNYESIACLRAATLDIFFDERLLEVLTAATGHPRFHLMQSMLFDKNAATPPHQDWWYLDSVPNGQLAAAWIALEDIAPEAGRFYVMSGMHEISLHEDLRSLRHDHWLELMREYVDTNRDKIVAPEMKKGDVIIWNSRTIHGSLPTQDPKFSRKSLTAHYLPAQLKFGNLFVTKDWVKLTRFGDHSYFANQPEYSLLNDAMARIKVATYNNPTLMRAARWVQGRLAGR